MKVSKDRHQHDQIPSRDSNFGPSYQLKACKNKVKVEPMKQMAAYLPGHTIRPIEMFGLCINGLDYRLIDTIDVALEVPLNAGDRVIPGAKKDARIRVKPNTVALLSLGLKRNSDGVLALADFTLGFNHGITVKNPASSLQPNSDSSFDSLKDCIADVKIKHVIIDEHGDVFVNGKIKAFGIIKEQLPRKFHHIDVPRLNEEFLASIGLINGSSTSSKTPLQKRFDIKTILAQIGALTTKIHYTVSLKGDPSQISMLKGNTNFEGPEAPIAARLQGIICVNDEHAVTIDIDSKHSHASCSLGQFQPGLRAKISHIGGDASMRVAAQGCIKGTGTELTLDTFAKQRVTGILPRRGQSPSLRKDMPMSNNEFNASMGAERVDFAGRFCVQADVKRELLNAKGKVDLNLNILKPYAQTLERGVTMDGHMSLHAKLENIVYENARGITSGDSTINIGVHPSDQTKKTFPELRKVVFTYDVKLKEGGMARVTPPEYGITRFLRPVINYEGHNERVDNSITKTPLHRIGSVEYFAHVEKLTGAKLRRAATVKILVDGINSLPERLRIINEAKDSICLQTLVFKDDRSGWEIARALVAAQQRGVRVYGVVDSLGNLETISGIENEHPIYEYLRVNGVHLQVYNSFVEQALRTLFAIVKKYPKVFAIKSPQSLSRLVDMLRFLERVVDVAEDKNKEIPHTDRTQLKTAVHTLLNGKSGVLPETSVQELRNALKDNMTTLDELLQILKRTGSASFRWHEKYLIADDRVAVVGGMNIADEYMRGGRNETVVIGKKRQPAWRDTDVLLEGSIVRDVFRSFRRNWFHLTNERLVLKRSEPKDTEQNQSFSVSIIQHRPFEDGDHKVLNFLLYNLRTLKPGEKAWFETAYFLPRGILRALQRELVAAAKRGVDVRILTNSKETSDFGLLVEAAAFDVRELLEAGARVYYRNQGRMVHAKVMVLGDQLTMVGSWNIDNRSAMHDSEDVCTIYDKSTTDEMISVLQVDMNEQSTEVLLSDLQNRSLVQEIRSAGILLVGELV